VENYHSHVAGLIPDLDGEGGSLLFPLLERLCEKLERSGPVPSEALLFTATTKAGIDVLERHLRGLPARCDEMLLAECARAVRARFGLNDTGVNVSAACASSTLAVARAAAAIASGRAEAALVCAADVITEFVFSGFSALHALSPTPCRPFDAGRDGLSLGDGASALLLMSRERAKREGRKPLAALTGWGAANDATHITAPARDGCGLIDATTRALARAGVTPDGIGAISAHGTGTLFNDAMELTAFSAVFGAVFGGAFGAGQPPLFSVKGAIGHTMGAAGAIEVALCARALAEGIVPPTAGLREPDPQAAGWVSAETAKLEIPRLLTTNSGFGGINAALVLEREAGA
jgi:3-oxoacyl-[acyl-carrier-protein] synthase II